MATAMKNSILIVDDEKTNLLYLNHILCEEYTIYTAKDGAEAVERANNYLPDLILLDIIMPGTDGYGVIAELKASEKTKAIPVIFITGLDSSDDEKKGLTLGAEDYISKPFSDAIVQLRVRNQLKIVNQMRALDKRLKQQTLMTAISKSFLTEALVDTLFTNTLRMIGEFMELGQVLLFKLDDDNTTLVCQNEWLNPKMNLESHIGSELALQESIRSVIYKLKKSGEDLYLLPIESFFKSPMAPYRASFKNFITKPIFNKGKMCAVLDFSREDDGREWDESEITLATLVASVFSGVFERDAMESQSAIVNNSPNLILYIGADGTVEYVNPAAMAVTGYSRTELLSGGLNLIFDEQTVKDIIRNRMPYSLLEGITTFDINMTCKNGQPQTLTVSLFKTGTIKFTIMARDIKK